MFSMPPATMHSASPRRIAGAANATVFNPEPHTLLTVMAGTAVDRLAPKAACRAGFWPRPACSTFPIRISSTWSASMPARRMASSTTVAPSVVAGTSPNMPPTVPTGVRTALTMTASSILVALLVTGGHERSLPRGALTVTTSYGARLHASVPASLCGWPEASYAVPANAPPCTPFGRSGKCGWWGYPATRVRIPLAPRFPYQIRHLDHTHCKMSRPSRLTSGLSDANGDADHWQGRVRAAE